MTRRRRKYNKDQLEFIVMVLWGLVALVLFWCLVGLAAWSLFW